MVHSVGHFDCPAVGSNIILGASLRMLMGEMNFKWVDWKADRPF